jgi:transcriptional regulator with GAF, ATPase, and Fis domain
VKFRSDLFARVSGIKVTLPPLRDRREDLGVLIATLLMRVAGDTAAKLSFDARAARALFRYKWPLNIRELEKSLAAAVVLAGTNAIEVEHLPPAVGAALVGGAETVPNVTGDRGRPDEEDDEDDSRPLSEADLKRKEELVGLLREHKGNVSAIARAMGKARMQIQRWIKRYKLDPESFRRG